MPGEHEGHLTVGDLFSLCEQDGIALDHDDDGHLTRRDAAGGDVARHQAR